MAGFPSSLSSPPGRGEGLFSTTLYLPSPSSQDLPRPFSSSSSSSSSFSTQTHIPPPRLAASGQAPPEEKEGRIVSQASYTSKDATTVRGLLPRDEGRGDRTGGGEMKDGNLPDKQRKKQAEEREEGNKASLQSGVASTFHPPPPPPSLSVPLSSSSSSSPPRPVHSPSLSFSKHDWVLARYLHSLISRESLQQPSFFEVYAQQKLLEGLQAALGHVVDVLRDQVELHELRVSRRAERLQERRRRRGAEERERRRPDEEEDAVSRATREEAGGRATGRERTRPQGEEGEKEAYGGDVGTSRTTARDRSRVVGSVVSSRRGRGKKSKGNEKQKQSGLYSSASFLMSMLGHLRRIRKSSKHFMQEKWRNVSAVQISLWLLRHWEIIYSILLASVEVQCLYTSSASFAENFYGLRRVDRALFALSLGRDDLGPSREKTSQKGAVTEKEKERQAVGEREEGEKKRLLPLLRCVGNLAFRYRDFRTSVGESGKEEEGGWRCIGLKKRKIFWSVVFLLLPLLRRKIHAEYLRGVRTLGQREYQRAGVFFRPRRADASSPPQDFLHTGEGRVVRDSSRNNSQDEREQQSGHADHQRAEGPAQGSGRRREREVEGRGQLRRVLSSWLFSLPRQAFLRCRDAVSRALRSFYRAYLIVFYEQLLRNRLHLFVRAYPYVCGLHDLICFLYSLLYLADASEFPYWSPYMHALGLVYIRTPPPPASSASSSSSSKGDLRSLLSLSRKNRGLSAERFPLLTRTSHYVLTLFGKGIRSALVGIVVLLKLMDWWRQYDEAVRTLGRGGGYNHAGLVGGGGGGGVSLGGGGGAGGFELGPHVDFGRDGRAGEETGALSGVEGHQTRQLKKELPAPPPSPPDFFELDQSLKMSRGKRGGPREQGSQAEEEEEGILLPQDESLCPLCVKPRSNPACIPSGYVFCYRCIVTYVRSHGHCPVTKLKILEGHIRRIYEPGAS